MKKFALKIRGLPWESTIKDIEKLFKGKDLIPESIKFGKNYKGLPNGIAVVLFKNKEGLLDSIANLQRKRIGARYVELFHIDDNTYLKFDDL